MELLTGVVAGQEDALASVRRHLKPVTSLKRADGKENAGADPKYVETSITEGDSQRSACARVLTTHTSSLQVSRAKVCPHASKDGH